jgi:hypothetical protein
VLPIPGLMSFPTMCRLPRASSEIPQLSRRWPLTAARSERSFREACCILVAVVKSPGYSSPSHASGVLDSRELPVSAELPATCFLGGGAWPANGIGPLAQRAR